MLQVRNKYVIYIQSYNSRLTLEKQYSLIYQTIKKSDLDEIAVFGEKEKHIKYSESKLHEAFLYAETNNISLVIAEFYSIMYNNRFLNDLTNSNVHFVFCDFPEIDDSNLDFICTLTDYVMRKKSSSIKKGIKENRDKQSLYTFSDADRKKGLSKRKEKADNNPNVLRAIPVIRQHRENGDSFYSIAKRLNNNGYKTRTGSSFYPEQVRRIYYTYILI